MDTSVAFNLLEEVSSGLRDIIGDALDGGALASPPADLTEWAEQLSFVPAAELQGELTSRFSVTARIRQSIFQKVDVDGVGPINLDHFHVRVTDPTIDGVKLNAADMLRFMRKYFGEIFDEEFGSFAPYEDTVPVDQAFIDGDNYLGAVLHIRIPIFGTTIGVNPLYRDDGAVAVVIAEEHRFRVATIRTIQDWGHPVSGYREWGVEEGPQGMIMYTRGTDRATGFFAGAVGKAAESSFRKGENLWRSWQLGLVRKIKQHGGEATVGEEVSRRYRWGTAQGVKARYFKPNGTWQD